MLLQFKDEAEFRENWIGPFLNKLGYILISHIHGSAEQGRDFFFADFDRFEHRRFYAVQAKLGNIGAGQRELESLLNQVHRSFTVKLRFHKEADEKHVSAVYIMASGTISREAREFISDWCKKQMFGENVYYLDGDTLERLEKYAFQRIDTQLRNQLIGVLNECQYNSQIITAVHRLFQKKQTLFERCRFFALEQMLASPPPDEILPFPWMQGAWRRLTQLNKLCDYHLLPMSTTDQEWQERVEIAEKTAEANTRMQEAAAQVIRKLDQRYAITVEVLE
jgi:hypothetical protein